MLVGKRGAAKRRQADPGSADLDESLDERVLPDRETRAARAPCLHRFRIAPRGADLTLVATRVGLEPFLGPRDRYGRFDELAECTGRKPPKAIDWTMIPGIKKFT